MVPIVVSLAQFMLITCQENINLLDLKCLATSYHADNDWTKLLIG